MKRLHYLAVIGALAACKAPSYHYVSPSLNHTVHPHAGSGHAGLHFGSNGFGAKGGYALSDQVSVNALLGALPEVDNGYDSRESEFSVGIQTRPRKENVTKFYLGLGFGRNEKDKIGLAGSYTRPFVQVQHSAFDKPLFSGNTKADFSMGVRASYLLYNGQLNSADFNENVFYSEPYIGFAIGGQLVKFEILQGFPIKMSGTWGKGVRILPYSGSIGVLFRWRNGR